MEAATTLDDLRNVPKDLRARPQWVCWRFVERGGKRDKAPVSPFTGQSIDHTDPSNWRSFEDAGRRLSSDFVDGIGFVFSGRDPYCGVDLDRCRNAQTEGIQAWAWEIIRELDSYAEVSSSGTGVKVFLRGTLPGKGGTKAVGGHKVELYGTGRFFTVTGCRLPDTPGELRDGQQTLESLYGRAGGTGTRERFDTDRALAGVPEGERDNTLWKLACKLRNADVPQDVAEKLLSEADDDGDTDHTERVLELVERVEETGDPDLVWEALDALAKADVPVYQRAKRRLKETLGKELNLNDLEKAVNAARKRAKDSKPTDDELRDRWAERNPGELAFGLGGWMRYGWRQPGVWSPAAEYEVERQIEEVCVAAKAEGIRPTAALVASVERLARNTRAVSSELWDADPDVLVCRNGALHIPSGELGPHDPTHYAASGVPYDFDPKAEAPMWERFLREIIVPVVGEEGAASLQEFAGYALTTDVSHEVALWLCGPPGGGRSTFIFAMEAMLGERAGTLGLHEITTSQFALASVPGKTLLTATEQPAGYLKASHVLNKLISGDRIRVEEKYKSAYDVYPKAKLLWAMNDLPKLASSYDGLFRRVRVVRLPEIENKDPRVKETIASEGAGILNWALEGLARLKERGRFEVPEAIQSATQEWKESNDVAALFVAERCEKGEDYKVRGETLYATYSGWCSQNGFTPKNAKNAAEDWERLGFRRTRVKGRSYWHGVRVTPVVLVDDLDLSEKAG